jgi:hypothetical protein
MTDNQLVADYHDAHGQPTLAAIRRLDLEAALRALTFLHGSAGAARVQEALDYVADEG